MIRIEVRQLSAVRNARRILDDLTFNIDSGEFIGVLGPNGTGKTTLLRTLLGLQQGTGAITIDGRHLSRWPRRELARHLGYLPQGAVFHWPLNVRRAVGLGRFPHQSRVQRAPHTDDGIIDTAMEIAGITDLATRRVDQLSGGERMRVHLARLLAGRHRAIFADEPITSLDPRYQLHFMSIMQQQAEQGLAVVISLHDLSLAARFCSRLLVLHDGHLAVDDVPAAALTDTTLADVFNVEVARLRTPDGKVTLVPIDIRQSDGPGIT